MLSIVFCVGEAKDSNPELVTPELVSTILMTSTGVVSTVRLLGFLLLRAAGRATAGDVAVHKPGIIYWHHGCVDPHLFHVDPFSRGHCWCVVGCVSLFCGNILHICCMVIYVFVLQDIIVGLCINVTVIYFVTMGSKL